MPRTHKPEETTEEEGTATPDSTKSPDQGTHVYETLDFQFVLNPDFRKFTETFALQNG